MQLTNFNKIKKQNIMNLLKKGIYTLLISGLILSCEEEEIVPTENYTGTGLTEITFSI